MAVLNFIVLGDVGFLWEVLKVFNCVEKVFNISEEEFSVDRRYLEVLAETYRNVFFFWEIRG